MDDADQEILSGGTLSHSIKQPAGHTMIERWALCEEALDLSDWDRVTTRQLDPFRRVYMRDDLVVKIEMPHRMTSKNLRRRSLRGEYEIYCVCEGVRGIPDVVNWKESGEIHALFLQRMPGDPINIDNFPWFGIFVATIRLTGLSARLASRGVSHNDFEPSNILLADNGSISLIDFDQATKSSPILAMARALCGFPCYDLLVMTSVFYLLKLKMYLALKKILPANLYNALRRVKLLLTQAKNLRQLPTLDETATDQQRILLRAWRKAQSSDANAPGAGVAYYEISDGEYVFPGERPWINRWEVLSQTADFTDKRVLELGCNMGLLSIWLLKHSNASYSMAVDHDSEIIESAKLVAEAMSVSVDFVITDFDVNQSWEKRLLESNAEIVFALNVLNWVQDKDRLLDFLANFSVVVFEGHDSFDIEKERFASRGFSDIQLVSVSERNRPLIVFKKPA